MSSIYRRKGMRYLWVTRQLHASGRAQLGPLFPLQSHIVLCIRRLLLLMQLCRSERAASAEGKLALCLKQGIEPSSAGPSLFAV